MTNLYVDASDIYYRDEIGNISTLEVWPRANNLEVELRPRLPLFGGLRTKNGKLFFNYLVTYSLWLII
jgi:oligosaccharyltransferase complex subunit alpha (ribophorin I)